MKKFLLTAVCVSNFAYLALADIQDPPANDYGPTRKLGRGLSNLAFGVSEIPVTIAKINEQEGNNAAASYGVVHGLGRSWIRFHAGILELFTFPIPTNQRTFYPLLPSDIQKIHGGYQEFPPELGNESKYPYVRIY